MQFKANYDKFPHVQVEAENRSCVLGWDAVIKQVNGEIATGKKLVVIECYQGVLDEEVRTHFRNGLTYDVWIDSEDAFKSEDDILKMTYPDVTDDRIFGYLTRLNIEDYLDPGITLSLIEKIGTDKVTVIYGTGASLISPKPDLLIYADMARWEIQLRMRKKEVHK
jgi:hypothetical protein